MRLIYDHSIFMEPRVGGVLRHVLELVRGIHALPEASDVAITVEAGLYHAPVTATDFPPGKLRGRKSPRFVGSNRLYSMFNRRRLHRTLRSAADSRVVLHETLYGNTLDMPSHVKRIAVVHDTIWEDSQDRRRHAPQLLRKSRSINAADGLIFVSQATRAAFQRHYPPPAMEAVIHHGCELRTTRDRRLPGVAEPFILYVGQRGGYKNWSRLATAFVDSSLWKTHSLVSFGPPPSAVENEFVRASAARHRFVWQGGSDDDLADLYAAADCFVYPSLAEGFGIPLVEAAKLGCPVACSDIPPFREVLGEHAQFFPPTDPAAIASAVMTAIIAGRTAPLLEAAKAACDKYTWHRTAQATLDFYRQVAERERRDSPATREQLA
jgi:glycosyltransferase involved in cell wall biosynthesis